jgi:outer membrane protein
VDSTQTSTIAQDAKLNSLAGSINAEQSIFTGFRNFNAIKQAGARIRAGGAQLVATEQQVLNDVAGAYFNVQRNMAVYELNKQNVTVLMRQKEMAEARFEVGEITRTDVAQADARLAEARARLSNAQGDLAVARAAYAQLVGRIPGDLEPVETLPELPDTMEAAQALAAKYAPPLVGAREQVEVSRRQIFIAKGATLPSLSLTAGYQYAEQPNSFIDQSEEFTFGARASFPLFLGGANYSRIREATALHKSDQARLAEAERLVEARTISAWERLVAARAVTVSAQASVEANRLALEGVRQEAMVGTRTTLDVLNAEQELLNAEVSLVSARRDTQSAAFALLAAVGVLTPDAIGIDGALGDGALDLYDH